MIHRTSPESIDATVAAAVQAALPAAASTRGQRGELLLALADALEATRDTLVPLADAETGLGPGRLNGELDRTSFQLRAFAERVHAGAAHAVIDDAAVPGAPPRGHPHLLRVQVPLGPVAMFAASNFPFAFSVLGGDTVSALAAGCPVIVKAHPGHPNLSRAVFELARATVRRLGWHDGTLAIVEGAEPDVGLQLVRHPDIACVAFTGSVRGGQALWRECNARTRPIPFFGELGSINPVVLLPSALRGDQQALAGLLASSIAAGSGQFCTSPGLVLVPTDEEYDGFVTALGEALGRHPLHRMLTLGIREAFESGVARWRAHQDTSAIRYSDQRDGEAPTAVIMQVSARSFMEDPTLREEVFGAAALVLRTNSTAQTISVLRAVGGTLTVTLCGADSPNDENAQIFIAAKAIAGRVLFAGVPTGVAISAAQQHGGPWPASTAPQTTSVGFSAIERFLRPIALQDPPGWVMQAVKASEVVV